MKKKTTPKPVAKPFKATLERLQNKFGGWTILRIPFSVHKVWGTRGSLRVKGELHGFAFRTSLLPTHWPSVAKMEITATQTGQHFLIVNKKMQPGAQAFAGSIAQCRLEPDTDERAAVLPAELQRALREDRSVRAWFDRLSLSMRRWYCNWVAQPKSAASAVPSRLPSNSFPSWKRSMSFRPLSSLPSRAIPARWKAGAACPPPVAGELLFL